VDGEEVYVIVPDLNDAEALDNGEATFADQLDIEYGRNRPFQRRNAVYDLATMDSGNATLGITDPDRIGVADMQRR